jgi:hypothetical protein
VPALDLHDGADAAQLPVGVALAEVAPGEAVEIGELGVVAQLDDASEQRDVVVPALAEDRQGWRGSFRRLRARRLPATMLNSTLPSSQSYQVAVVAGDPSGRTVATTAGRGARTKRSNSGGSGGVGI